MFLKNIHNKIIAMEDVNSFQCIKTLYKNKSV